MYYQTEPTTMWFDRRLVLRRSPIHGIGTFATHDIAAGELLILVTGGIVVTTEDWQTGRVDLEDEMYNQETLAENVFIVTPKMFHYYINHCCEPNAVDLSRNGKATQYVALRHIHAQEEITADYYTEATLAMCACKSPRCRWKRQAS
jgi:SET domain-containing protein